jgi:hypothetical protein
MDLKAKAKSLGATEFGVSKVKGKRFYVIYDNKTINFGSDVGSTFIDHHDNNKKRAWIARHSKIKNKQGQYVYKLPSSPAFWSWHLLW